MTETNPQKELLGAPRRKRFLVRFRLGGAPTSLPHPMKTPHTPLRVRVAPREGPHMQKTFGFQGVDFSTLRHLYLKLPNKYCQAPCLEV